MLKNIAYSYKTDKFTKHSYLNEYSNLFDSCNLSIKNILEIGIQSGESISLWNTFFEKANIYGIDINKLPDNFVFSNRMFCYVDNAYDIDFIEKHFSNKKFDILIDDGPHTLESMIFFAKNYSKLVEKNGVIIIEDIQSINWIDEIIKSFPFELQKKVKVIDNRLIKNRYDDILIVVKL